MKIIETKNSTGPGNNLKAARRLAISANQKRVLITRDIPTLTKPSPPTHQLGFQSPPLRQILTSIGVKGIRLSIRRAIARFVYHNAIPTAENFSRLGVHKPKVISGGPQPILLIYQNFQSRVGTNLVPVLRLFHRCNGPENRCCQTWKCPFGTRANRSRAERPRCVNFRPHLPKSHTLTIDNTYCR